MAVNKKTTNWILSILGLFSATFSLWLILFSTSVFAACAAVITCPNNGPTLECSCPGQGTCTTTNTAVGCACAGKAVVQQNCPGGE